MKKRILIMSHALELGGVEKSLIGLLSALYPEICDIDLFLLRHEGELFDKIPGYVNLLPEIPAYTVLARPMKNVLFEGHILLTAARFAGRVMAKHYMKKHGHTDSGVPLEYSHKYTRHFMPDIQPDTEYDLAISFLTPHYFAADKVKAKKKLAWIHTDYSKIDVNVSSEYNMWNRYDNIVSISDACTKGFLDKFPSLESKIVKIENILPCSLIENQSAEEIPVGEMDGDEAVKILSVGRYCTAKNFDNVPEICSLILKRGLDVRWYIIGFGGDEALIKKKIRDYNMEDRVILLGKKDNPYPYMKKCDIYVQPSRYEGNCVSVREAQMLKKPVVITRYPTSPSQLQEGIDGIIAPVDNKGCAEVIADLICSPDRLKQLSEACAAGDYSNKQEVNKLYELF